METLENANDDEDLMATGNLEEEERGLRRSKSLCSVHNYIELESSNLSPLKRSKVFKKNYQDRHHPLFTEGDQIASPE